VKRKRIRNYKPRNKVRAFIFRGSQDLDLMEKYILKNNDYSLNVRENKMELNFQDLTFKENDYILIKDDGFEVLEEREFESEYILANGTKKVKK